MAASSPRAARFLTRTILAIIAVAIVAALVYSFLPKPVLVDLETVDRGRLQVTVDEDGQTRIKERFVVASPLSGRLLRIELDPGDSVQAGQTLLAAIEPVDPSLLDARQLAEAEARVKAAEARVKQADPQVESARAERDLAKDELDRVQELFRRGTVTKSDLERAETEYSTFEQNYRSAEFGQEVAQFELQLAEAARLRTRPIEESSGEDLPQNFAIISPISGRVLRVFQESSKVVTPGENLIELGDPADLEIVVDVLSSDAVQIRPGNEVRLEHWGGEAPLTGRVRLVEPSGFTKVSALGVEEQRVNVIIDFDEPVEYRDRLGDGFRVEARIVTWDEEDVLKVPVSALFRHDGQWAVFQVRDGRARLQDVEVGKRSGLEAQVIEGLEPGAQVIVHPGDQVQDGVTVEPRG